MLNDPNKESENEPIEVRCYFVRERNALAVRADFSILYRDYYLHLMQHELRYDEELDVVLKDALGGLALHLASRPRNEATAWTLSWQDPQYNLFVTGSNRHGNVVGRILTDNVKKQENNLFYSQITEDGLPNRQSTIEVNSEDFFQTIEEYYQQSEQRPARLFRYAEEDFVMVTAQPDCDMEWFNDLTDDTIRELDQNEELSLLEQRYYSFDCGCSLWKLLPVLGNLSPQAREELFAESDQPAVVNCPRCGARYGITREMLEVYLKKAIIRHGENPKSHY